MTGYAGAGRSALFEALCLARKVVPPAIKHHEPRVVHLPVQDPLFEQLVARFHPKKSVGPSLELVECPELPEDPERFHGVLAPALSNLSLMVLVCGGPNAGETFSPQAAMSQYLEGVTQSQRAIIERRLEQIESNLKKGKKDEQGLVEPLKNLRKRLSEASLIAPSLLTREEAAAAANFALVTVIPHFVVVNSAEPEKWRTWLSGWKHPCPLSFADIFLEKDLLELPEEERKEFMASYGLKTLAVYSLADDLYRAAGRTVFYTMNARELRAWDVPAGTPAIRAAGVIHSDMERGFIRAEIISAGDLLRAGDLGDAQRAGLVRHEGKDYIIQNGDIMTVHFNV